MKYNNHINYFTEDTSFELSQPDEISAWVRQAIQAEGFQSGTINIIFCSDAYLLSINTTYLNHDTFTDIITFDQSEDPALIEGDIFISIDRVKENASQYNKTFYSELLRVIIHGVLHLTGLNDKSRKEKEIMRIKEDNYLSLQSII